MLGQMSLFAPDKRLPLRRRVSIELTTLDNVRTMLEKYHYLHRVRVGRQLNYLVLIDGLVDGVITFAYPMLSVPLADVPSDELVEFARMFLAQNIPHSATCAIGQALRMVRADWAHSFPDAKPIRLVVSWSDKEYHKGTIYKAANFEHFRITKGCPHGNAASSKRGIRVSHDDYGHDKDCWIYWLR